MSKSFKIIVAVFTTIFVVFSTMFGVLAAYKLSELSLGDDIYIAGLEKTGEKVGMLNILLLGVDEGGFRSDTIMLLSIDGYSNRANVLSIPRDTMVKAKGYTIQKINALIGLGQEAAKSNKIDEPEEILIEMVKDITGLPIHYFVSVDFDGFKDIIDAFGGIEFNVPYNMNYDDPVQDLHIHLQKGPQHLDGQAAHDFVRFRHNNDGSAPGEYVMGDEGRQYWQQKFVREFMRQKCKPQYIAKIDDLFGVIKENVRTNYTMRDLLKHLYLAQEIDIDEIGMYQLPGIAEYIGGVWWYKNDKSATQKLINDIFLPKEEKEWEEYKGNNIATDDYQTFDEKINAGGVSSVTKID